MKKIILQAFLFFACITICSAQNAHPFWDDVQTIKKFDKIYAPPVNPILFIGSSSIRKWDDLALTFAPYTAINRGIGGAVINDIIYYANDLIFPYKPRQIVIYVGENDLVDVASTPDSILNRTMLLFKTIRQELPTIPIVYISFKPSPSRDKFMQKAIDCNRLIKNFVETDKHAVYVDVFNKMLSKDGKSMPQYFLDDMLHMKPNGYAIWYTAILPYLKK